MSIVPAGVHDTRVLGDEIVRIRLLNGEGVHVRTKCNDRTFAVVEFSDHAGPTDPGADGEPEHLHFPRCDSRGPDLLEREFRMLMKISTYRSEVCGERLGLFEKIHGASGVQSSWLSIKRNQD